MLLLAVRAAQCDGTVIAVEPRGCAGQGWSVGGAGCRARGGRCVIQDSNLGLDPWPWLILAHGTYMLHCKRS